MEKRWCKQCQRKKPETDFLLWIEERHKGAKVKICNPRAQENMAKWGRTDLSKMKADEVRDAGD